MTSRELRLVLTFDDLQQAATFFRDVLGLEQLASWENDGGHAILLDAGHATLELFDQAQARAIDQIEVGRRVAGQVRLAFEVQNSDAMATTLVDGGAQLIAGPVTTPWGERNARLRGPGGIQLTLFTPKAEP